MSRSLFGRLERPEDLPQKIFQALEWVGRREDHSARGAGIH